MKYKEGQIVFFRWDSFFSKLISIYNTREYGVKGYSHIGIITRVDKETIQIHEAISSGFAKSNYPKTFIENQIVKGTIKIGEVKKRLFDVQWNADNYLGRPYAWYDIFSISLYMLFGFKGFKLTGAKKLICSEAVSRILYDASNKKINFSEEFDKPYDLITPQDIYMSKYLK